MPVTASKRKILAPALAGRYPSLRLRTFLLQNPLLFSHSPQDGCRYLVSDSGRMLTRFAQKIFIGEPYVSKPLGQFIESALVVIRCAGSCEFGTIPSSNANGFHNMGNQQGRQSSPRLNGTAFHCRVIPRCRGSFARGQTESSPQ